MKKLLIALIASALVAPAASAQVFVKGYVKSDGTYVAPHYRSKPNSTKLDNYSTKGNVNPYTGKVGTNDVSSDPYNYGSQNSSPYGSSSDTDSDSYEYDPD